VPCCILRLDVNRICLCASFRSDSYSTTGVNVYVVYPSLPGGDSLDGIAEGRLLVVITMSTDDRRLLPVYHTERPPFCVQRVARVGLRQMRLVLPVPRFFSNSRSILAEQNRRISFKFVSQFYLLSIMCSITALNVWLILTEALYAYAYSL